MQLLFGAALGCVLFLATQAAWRRTARARQSADLDFLVGVVEHMRPEFDEEQSDRLGDALALINRMRCGKV